mmetsp:Transcript_2142/g.4466  ORF Transcript_2142/g.4466 Transcript_2142/m.4466 type:complete len:205 (+) Transcript_2142:129-743(+)
MGECLAAVHAVGALVRLRHVQLGGVDAELLSHLQHAVEGHSAGQLRRARQHPQVLHLDDTERLGAAVDQSNFVVLCSGAGEVEHPVRRVEVGEEGHLQLGARHLLGLADRFRDLSLGGVLASLVVDTHQAVALQGVVGGSAHQALLKEVAESLVGADLVPYTKVILEHEVGVICGRLRARSGSHSQQSHKGEQGECDGAHGEQG